MEFEKCREILLLEYEAVLKAAGLQKLIEDALIQQNWTDFETNIDALNECSASLMEMEKEREALFSADDFSGVDIAGLNPVHAYQKAHLAVELAGGDKGRFYTLCLHFTPQQRSELGEIYRSLKLEALKLRSLNESLLDYIREIRASMANFFEMAFPDKCGKTYTCRGAAASHDMRSMVLNQRM